MSCANNFILIDQILPLDTLVALFRENNFEWLYSSWLLASIIDLYPRREVIPIYENT